MSKTTLKNSLNIKQELERGRTLLLNFKWGTSKGQDTYGYNICNCFIDGEKVGSCMGGGYDMEGSTVGEFLNNAYHEEMQELTGYYGLNNGYANGACGLNEMIKIIEGLGFETEYHWNKKDGTMYFINKK